MTRRFGRNPPSNLHRELIVNIDVVVILGGGTGLGEFREGAFDRGGVDRVVWFLVHVVWRFVFELAVSAGTAVHVWQTGAVLAVSGGCEGLVFGVKIRAEGREAARGVVHGGGQRASRQVRSVAIE